MESGEVKCGGCETWRGPLSGLGAHIETQHPELVRPGGIAYWSRAEDESSWAVRGFNCGHPIVARFLAMMLNGAIDGWLAIKGMLSELAQIWRELLGGEIQA